MRSYARATGLDLDPAALCADLLIADLVLPDSDAFKLLRSLRNVGWSGEALLISGYLRPEHIRMAITAGFAGVLAKPFRDADLTRALADLGKTGSGKPT